MSIEIRSTNSSRRETEVKNSAPQISTFLATVSTFEDDGSRHSSLRCASPDFADVRKFLLAFIDDEVVPNSGDELPVSPRSIALCGRADFSGRVRVARLSRVEV